MKWLIERAAARLVETPDQKRKRVAKEEATRARTPTPRPLTNHEELDRNYDQIVAVADEARYARVRADKNASPADRLWAHNHVAGLKMGKP